MGARHRAGDMGCSCARGRPPEGPPSGMRCVRGTTTSTQRRAHTVSPSCVPSVSPAPPGGGSRKLGALGWRGRRVLRAAAGTLHHVNHTSHSAADELLMGPWCYLCMRPGGCGGAWPGYHHGPGARPQDHPPHRPQADVPPAKTHRTPYDNTNFLIAAIRLLRN